MKVFRLVLCLAGLAVYLVVRPASESSSSPNAPKAPPKARSFTVESSQNNVVPAASLPESGLIASKPSR